ncbi:MAG: ArnT family glycosyltransferase [Candidatus Baltobacteraceae bacterium]
MHSPLLDHPGWRQGDTASIARNFATLQFNIFYPQTNYDGPPPNYVELELQIVPFLAATGYKVFGVHEVFGRLISLAFSLGTVALAGLFARRLFASGTAGIFAAFVYAVMPGSIYYGRTFTPDTTMVFFLTAALYAFTGLLAEDEAWTWRAAASAGTLLLFALLAKPVAAVAYIPIAALAVERMRAGRTLNAAMLAAVLLVPAAVLLAYDRFVAAHAEWHWASGITAKHVVPALAAAFESPAALHVKFTQLHQVLNMLVHTMTGPAAAGLALAGLVFMPLATRTRTLLWSWFAGALAYAFVVVTVERVDYYLYVFLPLAAIAAGGLAVRLRDAAAPRVTGRFARCAACGIVLVILAAMVRQNVAIAAPYYRYSRTVYRNAVMLDAQLDKNALVVMGHYDPSVLYYIGRYGWEEDPYLWTPFDEQSAIRKGARYYIDIERNRFARNLELCAWMQRFPLLEKGAQWPVFVTDPRLAGRHADAQWRSFRSAEAEGMGRAWLDAHGQCLLNKG